MPSKIQLRRGLAAQWTATNPVLSTGEVGYETDTKRRKTGDGATAWVSLPYDIDLATANGTYERLTTVNVKDNPYANLVGDGRELSDVSISLASQTLTSPSAPFTAADIGKVITLTGAGASGGPLTSRPGGNARAIVSVSADGTQATFDDPSHTAAVTAVVGPRTVTAATTRGSRTVTAADGAFTASDVGKDISIPLSTGNDRPSLLSQVGVSTAASAVVTSANACFLTSHVGQYVRVARAGSAGGAIVGKIVSRASATSVTLDTNAVVSVTNAEIVLLGTPRTISTKITSVVDSTNITIQRTADFTVAPVASTVSGGYAFYSTDEAVALDTLMAAVPAGAVLTFPAGMYGIGLSGTHNIGRVTFRGLSPAATILHVGTNPGRLVAAGSNATFQDLTLQALPSPSLELFGNAAAGSAFTDWTFRNVKLRGCGAQFSRQGRVDNLGATQATGTGISSRLTLVDVEVAGTLGFGLHIYGVDDLQMERVSVHNTGAQTTDVGIKIGSGASRPVLSNVTVYLNAADGCDLFDASAPKVSNFVGYMNGDIALDIKWNSANNYNSPERSEIVNSDCSYNWGVGANLSQPRMAVTNLKTNGNGGSGATVGSGATGTVDLARHSTFTALEANGNGGRGIVVEADRHTFVGCHAHGNSTYGFYNNIGTNHTFIGCRARDNAIAGIYHGPTATGIQQQNCTTQDPNGQWTADAAATFLLANGYGEQAAGTGNPPTAASWPVGALVVNTSDGTKWRRNFTTFVAA